MFTFIKSEPGLWTVGHHDQSGQWIAESDHDREEKAAKRVHYLNGGLAPQASNAPLVKDMTMREYYAAKAMESMLNGLRPDDLTPSFRESVSEQAYAMADAMLEQAQK